MPISHRKENADKSVSLMKHNLKQQQLQSHANPEPSDSNGQGKSLSTKTRLRLTQQSSLHLPALLITAALLFTALLGGFITGNWEPFRVLCPFAIGVLAGQLPQRTPP